MELSEIKELIAVADRVSEGGKEIEITVPNQITIRIGGKRQAVMQNQQKQQAKPNVPSIADMLAGYGIKVEDFKPYENGKNGNP